MNLRSLTQFSVSLALLGVVSVASACGASNANVLGTGTDDAGDGDGDGDGDGNGDGGSFSSGGGSTTECEPEETACDSGVPQLCSSQGQWVVQPACTDETPMCWEGVCVVCAPDEVGCRENAPRQCAEDGSSWMLEDPCHGDTPACLGETGTCGTCAEGANICSSDGSAVLTCGDNGNWLAPVDCPPGTPACVDGKCEECDPARGTGRRCLGDVPQICAGTSWVTQAPCSDPTPLCIPETGLCGCSSGQRCLDGNTPQQCSAEGQWVNLPDCSGSLPVCQSATGACGCVENEQRCVDDSGRERCVEGQWVSISACSSTTPVCDGTGQCLPCRDGQADRCSPDNVSIQECQDNSWENKQGCAGSDLGVCDSGACTTTTLSSQFIACGDSYCETGVETCCANENGTPFCTEGSCPAQECTTSTLEEARITCDGSNDCPSGQRCCLSERLDDTCGLFPEAINEKRTFCASDCTNTNTNTSYYLEFAVCDGPESCPNDNVECFVHTLGEQELYACDIYNWLEP